MPLTVHARYTRREILAAFGDGDKVLPLRWDSGVKWRRSETDLLAFTLDKSSGDFSPTTRYRDYAISRDLIHWESQSVASSPARPASATCPRRPRDEGHAVRTGERNRSSLLVPRPGDLRQPRGRTTDRDHVAVGAPPARRPVHRVRRAAVA